MRASDDKLPHFMEVCGSDRFGESKFPGKNRRDTNLVGFNVHVGGDNGTSGIVYTFTLSRYV